MKYTFTDDSGKQKTVVIPDDYISKSKKDLGLSTKEALDMYLADEGYITNPVVAELTAKAKANGVGGATKSRKAPKRKEDPVKRELIKALEEFMNSYAGQGGSADNVAVVNPERVISFTLGNDTYELTLSKKRKK